MNTFFIDYENNCSGYNKVFTVFVVLPWILKHLALFILEETKEHAKTIFLGAFTVPMTFCVMKT